MIVFKQAQIEDINWDVLLKQSKTATFFQSKEWLTLWVKHFAQNALFWKAEDDGKQVGVVPLLISPNVIDLLGTSKVLGNEFISDFGDILVYSGYEEHVWQALIQKFKLDYSSYTIHLSFIREESPTYPVLKKLGLDAKTVDVSPFINLPSSWEEYLLGLDRHNRHEIKRKIRRLEAEGAFKVCHDGDPTDIDEFFRLMSLSKEQKHNFLSEPMKVFFKEVIAEFWHKKMLWLCFLKLDGVNIAATVNFLYNNEILLYNSGFNPDFSYLSPGLLLKAFIIKHSIEERKRRFDFLRGGERYKYNLGAKERKLYRFTFT